jgi:hypothetical protein
MIYVTSSWYKNNIRFSTFFLYQNTKNIKVKMSRESIIGLHLVSKDVGLCSMFNGSKYLVPNY